MPGWNFAAVWDGIAEAIPEREAVVCGEQRITWGQFADRAGRLAWYLREHAGLQPGDKVAIDLTNRNEYLETFYAALKLGCVPCNVNFRYQVDEVHYLFDNSDAKACVHGPEFTAVVRDAASRIDEATRPSLLEAGPDYEAALASAPPTSEWTGRPPDGDDLVFLYTGGTTGMPKGVMWRNDDLYAGLWASAHLDRPEPPDPVAAALAGKRAATALPAAPLMHGTGLFSTLSVLAGSGTVVLVDRQGLDPELLWDTVARERVQLLTIVGDVFARPLLAALHANPGRWDLSSLRAINSSGVLFSPQVKQAVLAEIPSATIADMLGASEAFGPRHVSAEAERVESATFRVSDRVRVLDPDTGDDIVPGSGVEGMVAMRGNIPLGYYKDPEKTATTFRTFGGVRYSVPGDHATVDADGVVHLLGRGSACINTGGEKVFPEEVEGQLRTHPAVFDCVIVGVPDERFGERVVALVVTADRQPVDERELADACRGALADYKTPRRFLFVDTLDRSAAGKADYRRLRQVAVDLLTTDRA